MALSDRQLLDSLSRMPFADPAEPAGALGEPHATIHRGLTGLLADGIVGRVSHGAAHQTSLELSDRASFGSIPLRKDGSQSYNSRVALGNLYSVQGVVTNVGIPSICGYICIRV